MKTLTVLLLLLPFLATADPGNATRWLMNEPASLMDIGLLRAQIRLDAEDLLMNSIDYYEENEDIAIDSSIGYDFERDTIFVSIYLRNAKRPKGLCKILLKHYVNTVSIGLKYWFPHAEYSTEETPKDLVDRLRERVELQCHASSNEEEPAAEGRRTLLDAKVYWAE